MQWTKNIPKKWWQSKLLCFFCDLSNIQKWNFKECPLTWVGSFDCVFTHLSWSKQPIVHLFQVLLLLTSIVKNVTIIISWSISFTLTYWNSSILDYLICLFVYFFIFPTPRNNIHICEGLGRHIITLKVDMEIFHEVLKPLLIVIMAPCHLKSHLTIVWIQIIHWRKNMKNYGLWISCMIFFYIHFFFLQSL